MTPELRPYRPNRFSRAGIPKLERAINTRRHNLLAIGTELSMVDWFLMRQSVRDRLARSRVPHLHRVVADRGQCAFPIPTERRMTVILKPAVFQCGRNFLAGGRVPEARRAIPTASEDSTPVTA